MEHNTKQPILRVTSAKALGTKLTEQARASKLINVASSNLLRARTKYLCMVGDSNLDLQLFTLSATTREPVRVTDDYFNDDTVCYDDATDGTSYTLCSILLKSKSMPLIMVWYSAAKHVLYYALFYVHMSPQPMALDGIMQQISTLYYKYNPRCIDLGYQLVNATEDNWLDVLANHEKMEVENTDVNVQPVVGRPVVYVNNQPQPLPHARINTPRRVVYIVATEPGRWTWRAEGVGTNPKIVVEEMYMRGAQARSSVITRCKERMLEKYPNNIIEFKVTQQPRSKDPLKETGQKFLDSVISSYFGVAQTSTIDIQTYGNHVPNDPNVVIITLFALARPQTAQEQCWIALVCDDDKQIAFEMRGVDAHVLVEEVKQRVRAVLQRPDIGFALEVQEKKEDPIRNFTNTWLASARPDAFSSWARPFLNFFS